VNHYMEFGGGLGDIFQNIYVYGAYRFLDKMPEGDRATITLITHNPFAQQIFDNHPRAKDITVRNLGYWSPAEDSEKRRDHGLPPPPHPGAYPHRFEPIRFYPTFMDVEYIRILERRRSYLVIAPSAGLPDRDIPMGIALEVVETFMARGISVVQVGRNYDRHGRKELRLQIGSNDHPGEFWDFVDGLSVPGVAELLRGSLGLITCHSSVSMLAWYMRKPNLLLYPESVRDGHFAKKDQWSFGANYKETVHGCFNDPGVAELINRFNRMIPV